MQNKWLVGVYKGARAQAYSTSFHACAYDYEGLQGFSTLTKCATMPLYSEHFQKAVTSRLVAFRVSSRTPHTLIIFFAAAIKFSGLVTPLLRLQKSRLLFYIGISARSAERNFQFSVAPLRIRLGGHPCHAYYFCHCY